MRGTDFWYMTFSTPAVIILESDDFSQREKWRGEKNQIARKKPMAADQLVLLQLSPHSSPPPLPSFPSYFYWHVMKIPLLPLSSCWMNTNFETKNLFFFFRSKKGRTLDDDDDHQERCKKRRGRRFRKEEGRERRKFIKNGCKSCWNVTISTFRSIGSEARIALIFQVNLGQFHLSWYEGEERSGGRTTVLAGDCWWGWMPRKKRRRRFLNEDDDREFRSCVSFLLPPLLQFRHKMFVLCISKGKRRKMRRGGEKISE